MTGESRLWLGIPGLSEEVQGSSSVALTEVSGRLLGRFYVLYLLDCYTIIGSVFGYQTIAGCQCIISIFSIVSNSFEMRLSGRTKQSRLWRGSPGRSKEVKVQGVAR